MDWATRRVLSWQLSSTMDAEFCIKALEDAFRLHGRPEIFSTDQGSQPSVQVGSATRPYRETRWPPKAKKLPGTSPASSSSWRSFATSSFGLCLFCPISRSQYGSKACFRDDHFSEARPNTLRPNSTGRRRRRIARTNSALATRRPAASKTSGTRNSRKQPRPAQPARAATSEVFALSVCASVSASQRHIRFEGRRISSLGCNRTRRGRAVPGFGGGRAQDGRFEAVWPPVSSSASQKQ